MLEFQQSRGRFKTKSATVCDHLPSPDIDINTCYSVFQRKLLDIVKRTIPRGFRNPYIPGWDSKCEVLEYGLEKAQSIPYKQQVANKLVEHLNSKRKATWTETVENIDMKHSSLKAWAAINKLAGRKNILPNPNSINPNPVASWPIKNGKLKQSNREFTRNVNRQLKMEWKSSSTDQDLCNDFSTNEVMAAIKTFKFGKAPVPDNLHPEFFLNLFKKCFEWLRILFSNCLSTKKLPKVWKIVQVIAALKLNKSADNPGSNRKISLLCIPSKLYKRLIYNRIKPITESVLPEEQAGFQPNRFTIDQVAVVTEDNEASFNKKLKAGVVPVDLSAAYDIVWHRGLTLRLLKTIPSKEMVRAIMGMISQRRFHVHIGKSK